MRKIKNQKSILLLALCLLSIVYCLLPVVLYAQVVDIVWVVNNGKITEKRGTIVKETYKGIELKATRGGTELISIERLAPNRSIQYKDEPIKYINAQRFQAKGDYSKAIEAYTTVIDEIETSRAIFKQHALYNRALCLQLTGKYDEAIQDYNTLLKEVEDTRYLREVYFNKVDCLVNQNNTDTAFKTIETARSKGRELSLEAIFILRLDLRKASIYKSVSKLIEAQVIYKRLETQRKHPEIAGQATLGLGDISSAKDEFGKAASYFRKAIEKSQIPAILAAAYNGLGDCLYKQAGKSNDRKLYKEALFAYLHTKLLYLPDPGESTKAHEKSIVQAAYCLKIIAKNLPEEKAVTYLDYARTLYQELIDKYPGSTYRPEVEKQLR